MALFCTTLIWFQAPVRADNDLSTNSGIYFLDETINITASWELNYEDNIELAYVQIHIYDQKDLLIWNSPKFYEKGSFTKNFSVDIKDLDLLRNITSQHVDVKLQHVYEDLQDQDNSFSMFIEEKRVETKKRSITCELTILKSEMDYGDVLTIKARFLENSTEQTRSLSSNMKIENKTVLLQILRGNEQVSQENITLTRYGQIEKTFKNLGVGDYYIVLEMVNDSLFNGYYIRESASIGKLIPIINLFVMIRELENIAQIEIEAFYLLKNETTPFENETLLLSIYNNESLKHREMLTTNSFGRINASISLDILDITHNNTKLTFRVELNKTSVTRKKLVSLVVPVNLEQLQVGMIFIVIEIISIVVFSISACFLIVSYKHSKKRKLIDITIRY